jgi:hypothetical protein
MTKPIRPWTRKEEELSLWWGTQGIKVVVIAHRLGRTYGAVKNKLKVLKRTKGVQTKPPPDRAKGELQKAVRRLHVPGVCDQDVADILGVTKSAVCHVRRSLKLPAWRKRGGGGRKQWVLGDPGGLPAAIIRLYGVWGRSDAEIAHLTGEPRFRVTYHREKLGIPACGRAGRPLKDKGGERCLRS